MCRYVYVDIGLRFWVETSYFLSYHTNSIAITPSITIVTITSVYITVYHDVYTILHVISYIHIYTYGALHVARTKSSEPF